jgi:polysaccharide pyruvyl transferase WcaK-like protein
VSRAGRTRTIAVWGHFHGRNLGDELVASIVIEAARRRVPGAEIVAISLGPGDTRERHGIAAYPINPGLPTGAAPADEAEAQGPGRLKEAARRLPFLHAVRTAELTLEDAGRGLVRELPFLRRSHRLLRGVDLVVVAGSGVLADNWGAWRHPYACFRWTLLARLARVPMVFPSVGVGPIETSAGRFFVKRAVGWCSRVSVRDADSRRALAAIGLDGPFDVVPDMAFALSDVGRSGARPRAEAGGAAVVGLNVMAHEDPRYFPSGDRPRYEAYVLKMAVFAEWLLEQGHTVRLFSSQTVADPLVAADVRRVLAERGRSDLARLEDASDRIRSVPELLAAIRDCDYVVAARFHAVLLALALEVPVLGLAYHAKTSELLADAEHLGRFLDIDRATQVELEDAFRSLSEAAPEEVAREQRSRLEQRRAAVERQFDVIFAAAGPAGAGAHAGRAEPDQTDGSISTVAGGHPPLRGQKM